MSKQGTFVSVSSDQEGATPRLVTETEPFPVSLFDGGGNSIGSFKGALNVHNADVHTFVINRLFRRDTETSAQLSAPTVGDGTEYQITLDSVSGFTVGSKVYINTSTAELTYPTVKAIVGNVLTLDRRIDRAHSIGDTVSVVVTDMASSAGTIASPVIYYVQPDTDVFPVHLTRILFSMTHSTAGDLGLFGNLAALANGVVLRAKVAGNYFTLTNWKINADMKTDMFDVEFDSRSGGGGSYGTSGRGTFTNAGAVVRLDGSRGDRLELLVQDDITLLELFEIKAQGHFEGDLSDGSYI